MCGTHTRHLAEERNTFFKTYLILPPTVFLFPFLPFQLWLMVNVHMQRPHIHRKLNPLAFLFSLPLLCCKNSAKSRWRIDHVSSGKLKQDGMNCVRSWVVWSQLTREEKPGQKRDEKAALSHNILQRKQLFSIYFYFSLYILY